MPQAIGGFILGAFAVFCLFFFDPDLGYELQLRVHGSGGHGRYGDVAVGVERPFALGETYADTSWYADSQDAGSTQQSGCDAVIALENRSNHTLIVDLTVHYRGRHDGEDAGFEPEDGPGNVTLEPGERAEQTIRADDAGDDARACAALNRPDTLMIGVEACPDEGGPAGKCEEEQVDPADAVMHDTPDSSARGGYGPARGSRGRQGL